MMVSNGLEKFSHLEDKIYRTIELTKTLRQEKDDLERQLATVRNQVATSRNFDSRLNGCWLSAKQSELRSRNMLDAVAATDPEIAEALRG